MLGKKKAKMIFRMAEDQISQALEAKGNEEKTADEFIQKELEKSVAKKRIDAMRDSIQRKRQ